MNFTIDPLSAAKSKITHHLQSNVVFAKLLSIIVHIPLKRIAAYKFITDDINAMYLASKVSLSAQPSTQIYPPCLAARVLPLDLGNGNVYCEIGGCNHALNPIKAAVDLQFWDHD